MKIIMKKRFEYKDLPDMNEIRSQIDKVAAHTTIGETLFFKKYGVKSEAEFKRKAMKEGYISKHSHIGWNSWDETAKNVEYIYNELERRGSYITRMGFIFDWVMGVPEEYRSKLQPGTGLIFKNPDEWKAIGQIAPIQPHMSDHMIGCPNALENAKLALEAGVTSIGNVSHYFTYEYPGLELERERTINSLLGFGLMGKFEGTIVHSNLDDGYGNQFHDLANLTGWTMIERYLVEELLGASMTFAYGNLFSNPISRIVFNMACDATNVKGTPGTMTFGNTIDYGLDFSRNYGALCNFSLADAICQRHKPTGHAVASVPVSEACRIPTPDEIIDGHLCIDMMIEKSKFFEPFIDWSRIEAERDILLACGRVFFERVMNGLEDLGVDIKHPGEVFAALKAIGAEQLEVNFGVGKKEKAAMRGREPVKPTDIVKTLQDKQRKVFASIGHIDRELESMKVLVGTTDIHDYGKEMIKSMLNVAGADVFDLGTYVTAQEIIENLMETESKVVVISTYNGIALSFAKELVKLLNKNGMDDVVIMMGGLLNENMDGSMLAADVTEEVKALGINCDNLMETIVPTVKKIYKGEYVR
ncbi:cobalamin-dependent protein [Lutispora saccharofermentans]|uniref:Cobalamin-dependent protein n=1 Tax=Lutispora saccharofermentans TaxID=3024236 RepID=A0ABT1NLA2_9FIRM|nr:cobalamin-dependent protein [Lutispora saccharofermentans]MCQ1530686.1 cobalamin-dependent protein [Lutispora saccharofermentans]